MSLAGAIREQYLRLACNGRLEDSAPPGRRAAVNHRLSLSARWLSGPASGPGGQQTRAMACGTVLAVTAQALLKRRGGSRRPEPVQEPGERIAHR